MATDETNPEQVWDVERVHACRYNDEEDCLEYLLSWIGYPGEYTWEKEYDCHCNALIRDFERRVKKIEDIRRGRQGPASASTPRTPRAKGKSKGSTKAKTSAKGKRRSERITTPTDDEVESVIIDDDDDDDDNNEGDQRCDGGYAADDHISTENDTANTSSKPRKSLSKLLKDADNLINVRKLRLSEIIAAVNGGDGHVTLVVRWAGIDEPEKVPLVVLRRDYPQQVIDFLLSHLKWMSE